MDVFDKLPCHLRYLVEPAKKYAAFETDDELDAFLENITQEQRNELQETLEKFINEEHQVEFDAFLDEYSICDYKQSSQLYFLFQTIDYAGIDVEGPEWNTVEKHMEALNRFGSFRLASARMHSAKFLADFGKDADPAIPLLEKALSDNDHRVRVWSNYALFHLTDNKEKLMGNIKDCLSSADSDVRTEAASALGSLNEAASETIPELISMIENPNEDEYDVGVYMGALVEIGKDLPIVTNTLLKASKSDIETIRDDAKELLAELGSES